MFKISVTTQIASAHRLREYDGACENLHGHNWLIRATVVSDQLDALGMVYDFKKLKAHLREITDPLDHRLINEVPPFDMVNPTSEQIAKFIFDSLAPKLPAPLRLASVEVGESANYLACYEPSC